MREDMNAFAEKMAAFRKSHQIRTKRFPIELKLEAVSLLKKYGYREIMDACPIGSSTLYKWKSETEIDRTKTKSTKAKATPDAGKKNPKKHLTHTRLNAINRIEVNGSQSFSGCIFEIGTIQFCINDPAFLAQAIQLLQVGTEERP